MRVGSDRFQIVLVRQEGVRRADEIAPQIRRHGDDNIFLPQKAVPPPRAKVGDAQLRNAAQPLNLAPQLGLGARIENVEPELAQCLQLRARLQFVENRQRIEFPHRGLGPRAFERQMDLPVAHRKLIIRQVEIVLQPLQKCRLENSAPSVERVACQPYQFRLPKPPPAHVLQLHFQFFDVDDVGHPHRGMPVEQRKRQRASSENASR